MNIGMIALPILKLQMPFENMEHGFFKMLNKMPYFAAIIISLVALSIWHIVYKMGKFENFLNGIMWVGIFTFIYSLSAGMIMQATKATLGKEISTILGLFPILISIFLISKDVLKSRNKPQESKEKEFSTKENKDSFNFKTVNGVINLGNPFRGIYIQGGAGSGKSASIFEPIIKQIAEQEYTGILYDFKSPELTEKIRASYSGSIVKFRNVDFKNPYQSDRINPIAPNYLTKSVIVLEYSQTLVNNLIPESIKKADFWSNNTKMILSGVIWWLKEEHPKFCTLPHAISLLLHTDIKMLLDKVSTNYEAAGMVASLKQSFEKEAGNQTAGILSTVQTAIAQLNSKDVFWMLSGNDIDLNLNNPQNPTFLCLGNDSTLPQVYAPVISLIISVAMRQMNKPNQQKSVVLLDEAPTIYIPNIEQIPATARSNKIATIFGVQDFSQLVDNYGQDKAQIILANLGNQFFGRVTNGKTAEMVKNLFSKEDRIFINKNTGTGTGGTIVHTQSNQSKGKSETIQERDRVKVSDLINLEPGEFYGIIAEGKPKEFLKTQFLEDFAENEANEKASVTEQEMSENYYRIIEESKSLI
ncbi:type IV secretion system DNA-binding domain-containing protein [Chryseobacterium muglaense]|uniref:Type IV secretion system DNA-binding domain-containing protein n=1 Tax=Chryseobacterium muglaense TaxID=2893752 RepID=A0ABR8MAB8_9FLAO|nr:type IV secretion system DNA-binding domain-containing protein [Chryseobacterium muglaense]MBD3907293.1 type IV secretion system DNA-binding domain-containing protein [Chryseobacterium muglaense]